MDRKSLTTMIFVPGGIFRMGSDKHYPEEAPVHRVTVDGFWIDRTPVTNRDFRKFVNDTGYVTFAEIAPNPADYPGALPHMLKAGSLVFTPPKDPIDRAHWSRWWNFKFGANWRRPYDRAAQLSGLDDHPVVHGAYRDAEADATWAGKAFPSEAEWEVAARGGLDGAEFAWGDEFTPGGQAHGANTWQGDFPRTEHWRSDGYRADVAGEVRSRRTATAPTIVIGNVWEWTSDWWCGQARGRRAESVLHSREPARRARKCELRPVPVQHQNSSQGHQGRLAPFRAELLSPLPPGRAPRGASGHFYEPCRIPMRHPGKERAA